MGRKRKPRPGDHVITPLTPAVWHVKAREMAGAIDTILARHLPKFATVVVSVQMLKLCRVVLLRGGAASDAGHEGRDDKKNERHRDIEEAVAKVRKAHSSWKPNRIAKEVALPGRRGWSARSIRKILSAQK
jgi:hypothetical protein